MQIHVRTEIRNQKSDWRNDASTGLEYLALTYHLATGLVNNRQIKLSIQQLHYLIITFQPNTQRLPEQIENDTRKGLLGTHSSEYHVILQEQLS